MWHPLKKWSCKFYEIITFCSCLLFMKSLGTPFLQIYFSTYRKTYCLYNNFNWQIYKYMALMNVSWPMQIQMIPQYIRYYTFILQVCIQFHRTFFCWSNAWLILITLVNLYTRANHVLIAGHWVWLWVWYRMPPPGSEVHRYKGLASGRTRLSMEGGRG